MSKVTKLHPARSSSNDLLEETLGEIAVEEGFKLPETEEELDIYEERISSDTAQRKALYSSIHEALADAENTREVRYQVKDQSVSQGSYAMAARNGDKIDDEMLAKMDEVADEDDDD